MASFGRYETVRELHRSGFTVLYSGRAKADSQAKFAIKVFQPSTLLLETEQVHTESDLFLNSAHVQQKTAGGGAEHWAPIRECNSIPDGAFYTTDLYDRSLQQLIDVRIKLSTQALRDIIESVAKGLLELKQACGRPHGNLKATNILIAGEGDLSQTSIVLSDPLPDEHIDNEVHWDTDLRDIAEIIYQLIRHRPTPSVGGWQITDSKKWSKLGKTANDWIDLCNRLLNAHMKPGTMTIETLIDELARLKKIKPVFSFRRLLIAIGFIVITGAAVFIIKPDLIFPPEPPSLSDWNQAFAEYWDWVKVLRIDLGLKWTGKWTGGNQQANKWISDPHMKPIVENIKKASYPYVVECDNGVTKVELEKIENEKDLRKYKIKDTRTTAALKAAQIIKFFFDIKSDTSTFSLYDPNSPTDRNEFQKWLVLDKIQKASENIGSRGWQRSATYLGNLMNDIKPDPNITGNVDKILVFKDKLDDIQSCWIELEKNEKIIANSGDPSFTRFNNYIKQEPAMVLDDTTISDVNNFSNKLLEELQNRKQLSRELAKSIDNNWQKLKENQKTIESTTDPILIKFPGYVKSRLVSANPDTLSQELEEMGNLADNIGKFIEEKWQEKVDQTTFLNDHGDDSEENLTDNTFTDRLVLIKDYLYLNPDPRKELYELIDSIDGYFPLARLTNPVEANICSENLSNLRKDIKKIEEKPVIEKYRPDITDAVNIHKPKLIKLEQRIIAATETPEKYHQRIRKKIAVSSEAAEEINKKWLTSRDNLLDRYPLSQLKENLGKYAELRKKIDDTNDNLETINEQLRIELPVQLEAEIKDVNWNDELKEIYALERNDALKRIVENIPLQNEIPDINAPSFIHFSRTQFSTFQQLQVNLSGILTAFNEIENGINKCYLLDQKLPDSDQTVRLIWNKWKDADILKDTRVNEILDGLTKRIKDLEKIENSDNRDTLGDIAADSNNQTEAMYAAWKKLDEFTDPQWPNTDKEWAKDKEIQGALRAKLLTIKAENRAIELTKILDDISDISLKHEKIYREANIRRYKTIVTNKSSTDPVLAKFESLEPYDADADLGEVIDFENRAKVLAEFVTDPNWPAKYRTDIFIKESPIYKKTSLTKNDFKTWMDGIKDYKIVKDPREDHPWKNKIEEIKKLIEDELERKQKGASKQNPVSAITSIITKPIENALGGKQTSSAEQSVEKLKQEYDKLKETEQEINAMLALSAIEKNKDKIDASICNKHWEILLTHEATVRSIIKPEYCKHLELLEGKVQRLVFSTTTELSADFEPVNISRLQSMTKEEQPLGDIFKFVQGSAESLLGLSRGVINKLPLSQLGEFFNKTVEIVGWEQIRQSVKSNDTEWLKFFHTIDLNKTKNVGWPKYIVSKKDPSLILRFIPADGGNPEPFYMAIQEVSNAQYRLYMENISAVKPGGIDIRNRFNDQSNNELINSSKYEDPARACKITWNGKSFSVAQGSDDIPVTWVTYSGAKSYAQWLNGQLPTVSQHKYACEAQGNIPPWANYQEIPAYAHVRGGEWKTAAGEYNNTLINSDELRTLIAKKAPAPVGAKPEDFVSQTTKLVLTQTVHEEQKYGSPWPIDHADRTNLWGLYDMIGNVWEWCRDDTQPTICGGSCLAPPKYVTDPSNYSVEFSNTACDVGFRIIVLAR